MKKRRTLAILAVAMATFGVPMFAQAQTSPTATTEIYDFTGFTDTGLLDLFANALDNGRKYPTQAEFEAAGIQAADIAFVRSHVRNKKILDRSDRLISDTYEKRDLWMNLPMSIGKALSVGQPSDNFADDVYSMWNYTNLFGSWNHGFFTAPGCWVDAAHKNGSNIFSGIKFFESWGTSSAAWNAVLSAKFSDGSFKYVKPIINCLMFFGSDGINYNWEDNGFSEDDVVAFNKALYKEAAAQGFNNFHLGLYTAFSSLSAYNANVLFGNSEGRTADTFLNYSGGDFATYNMQSSAKAAMNAMGTTEGLYAGAWIVNMDRSWSELNKTPEGKTVSLCLWGEHAQSRFMSYNTGADAYEQQNNYQFLLERAFSGGNRNPLNRPVVSDEGNKWEWSGTTPPLSTFAGLATWIPERSAIQGDLPFATNFSLGNGDRYNYNGKKTAGSYYNMANQDIVPTYRWLVVNPGTQTVNKDIVPEFTHDDAYIGGSCLKLTGKATSAGTDIVLYKTSLNVTSSGVYVKVAAKTGKAGTNASNLNVILKTKSGNWVEVPVGDIDGSTWTEKKIDVPGISQSDVIERIGLRVAGSNDNYKILVGKLEVNDKVTATPANVKDLVVDVKAESKNALTAKLFWDVDATAKTRADWGLVYNDEANIDHFEVLYKNGEDGRVSEVCRTTQWSTLINAIAFESVDDKPFIGVRSVSTDLKTYSPVVWVSVPRAEQSTLPDTKVADTYGTSTLNPSSEGYDDARLYRYLTKVTTTNADADINYTSNSRVEDNSNYCMIQGQTLKVHQGQTFDFFFKANEVSNGLKWCLAGCWLDLDGSGTFQPDAVEDNPSAGEKIFKLGTVRAGTDAFQNPGVHQSITIPNDAHTGKSRLRLVFADAWFAGTMLPTGLTANGFTLDIDVEITGTNAQRQPPVDAHDQGVADEPDGMSDPTGVNDKVNDKVSHADVTDGAINFKNVDKAWVYSVDGKLVKYIVAPKTMSTVNLANGVYIVKMQNGSVMRSNKVVLK